MSNITMPKLTTRAKAIVTGNTRSMDNLHTFLCDAIEGAQANSDNFTPIMLVLNGTKGLNTRQILSWLTTYAPIRYKRSDSGDLVLKLNKGDSAAAYDPELARLNPFWNMEKGEKGKPEYDLEKAAESFAKRLVKNVILTEKEREHVHALIEKAIDSALKSNKAKQAKEGATLAKVA